MYSREKREMLWPPPNHALQPNHALELCVSWPPSLILIR